MSTYKFFYFGFFFFLISTQCNANDYPFRSEELNAARKINTWKALRDKDVIKQNLDYSCGAASLATILRSFYKQPVGEKEILERMQDPDKAASFQGLAETAPLLGFKAGGLKLKFDQLASLKIPVIAHVTYRGEDHFTVVRGVRSDGIVSVGDPSWGNRQFTEQQFRRLWEIHDSAGEKTGRILLVIPNDTATQATSEDFFGAPFGWSNMLQTLPKAPH